MILLSLLISAASAMSSGKVPNCDIESAEWGCIPSMWPIDSVSGLPVRTNCSDKTRIMTWVNATQPGLDKFKLFAGLNEDASLTEYVPGERMMIGLRTLQFGWQMRGLLVYGKNAAGTKVGVFDTVDRQQQLSTQFCPNAIIHINADLKPYLITMGWTAPKAGTGDVTFSTLLKTGVANVGEFWSANKLVLKEKVGATPVQQTWYRSTVAGASCDEVCTQACAGTCVAGSLNAIDSPLAIDQLVAPFTFCAKPYLLRCGAEGPTSGTVDDATCFYRNSTACTALGLTSTATTCGAKPPASEPATAYRLCPCTGGTCGVATTTKPTTAGPTTTTKTVVTVTTTSKGAPTTTKPTTTTTTKPGDTTLPTTVPPPTSPVATTTASACPFGTLACPCDVGSTCQSPWKCVGGSCIVDKPCLYGELGCLCSPGVKECANDKLACDPVSKQCILKDRTQCDDGMNGAKGCWCRPFTDAIRCDEGLRCDSTNNCVLDVSFVCEAGQPGCGCKSDATCDEGSRCASFSGEKVCVTDITPSTTATQATSASTIAASFAALLVAMLALF